MSSVAWDRREALGPAPPIIGRLALGALWSARTQRPAGQLLAELRASRQPLHQSEVPPQGAQVPLPETALPTAR